MGAFIIAPDRNQNTNGINHLSPFLILIKFLLYTNSICENRIAKISIRHHEYQIDACNYTKNLVKPKNSPCSSFVNEIKKFKKFIIVHRAYVICNGKLACILKNLVAPKVFSFSRYVATQQAIQTFSNFILCE